MFFCLAFDLFPSSHLLAEGRKRKKKHMNMQLQWQQTAAEDFKQAAVSWSLRNLRKQYTFKSRKRLSFYMDPSGVHLHTAS